jgi:hypothetical protein
VAPQQTPNGPQAGSFTNCGSGSGQCPCQSAGSLFCGYCGSQCSYCPQGSYCPNPTNFCSSTTCAAQQSSPTCPGAARSLAVSCAGATLCCPATYAVCCADGATCATSQSACPGSGGNACKGAL